MNTSSRFVVAIHILAAITIKKDRPFKSEQLAWTVNTNPVVIRRILGMLRNAGLVISHTGPDGGSTIARNPEKISLLDIYAAVEDSNLFHLHYSSPNCDCPVGAHVQNSLCEIFNAAENAMKNVLRSKTLLQVTREILDRAGMSEKLASGRSIEKLQEKFTFRSGKFVEKSLE